MDALGIIARADLGSGLQFQTLNLCRMLNPSKVLIIDSTPFNDAVQRFDLYDEYNTEKVWGFPTIQQYRSWLQGLSAVLTAETFYNDNVIKFCLRNNIRTYCQPNYEFMDSMIRPMTSPTKYFMPSYWKIDEVKAKHPSTIYLPPPLFDNDFKNARETNLNRSGKRFLHIVGKYASKDRNGTESLLNALPYTNSDFELVIKSQGELPHSPSDSRVTFEYENVENNSELYKDFDAMILPRRYGGLCLPMQEALMSGLPVVMTDIEPNNRILPKEWLVPSYVKDTLLTRMIIDVYDTDPKDLAKTIDWLCETDLILEKKRAVELSNQYSADTLTKKYVEEMF